MAYRADAAATAWKDQGKSCSDPQLQTAAANYGELDSFSTELYGMMTSSRPGTFDWRYSKELVDMAQTYVPARTLDLADEATAAGCPNTAKALYMSVIETYVGTSYAAYRQRAEIGLSGLTK